MINLKMIYRIMGFLLLIEAAMLALCGGVSLFYHEDDLTAFMLSGGACLLAGALMFLMGKGAQRTLGRRDGYVVVTVAWVVFSCFGMLPFYLSGYIPSVTNAFFETMSGVSSTGATILDDIERLPHGLLFWRSMTQWIGGLGIIFFTIAVLPIFGVNGLQVFAAEACGMANDKLHPRIGITAKWIWSVYAGMTVVLVALLMAGGMNTFDSICHAFTTTGTGGFSTKQDSIAYYNSPYIDYIITLFMFLSGVNFTMLLCLVTGRFRKFFGNGELKWYTASTVAFTVLVTVGLCLTSTMDVEEAFRKAVFQVVSLHTSTGFATADYMAWAPVLWGLMLVIMIVGACAGSTSGGLKCIRMLVLFKVVRNEFKHIIHPNAVLPVRINKQAISPSIRSTILAFTFLYTLIIVVSTLIMMALGMGFVESIGCAVSSLGNMGPGLGSCGPAFSWDAIPEAAKWLNALLMLLGRLEIFTVFLLFTPDFWHRN